MFDWDATGAMARVTVPVLVLGGDIDIVTKLEASKVIASSSPGAVLKVIESANHMGMLDEAAQYHRLILDFASTVFLLGTPSDQPKDPFVAKTAGNEAKHGAPSAPFSANESRAPARKS